MIGSNWIKHHIGRSDDYSPANSQLSQLRHKGYGEAVLGAGLGATAGAAAGFGWGLHNLASDRVTVSTESVAVTIPRLTGARFESGWVQTMPGADIDGQQMPGSTIYHPDHWSPVIVNEPTGQTYERQHFHHSMPFGPLAGTLVGLGAGAVVGGLTGVLVKSLRPDTGTEGGPVDPHLAQKADLAPGLGLAAGGVLGAAAGAWAGQIAQSHVQSLGQLVREPVYETRSIGYLPSVKDYSALKPFLEPDNRLDLTRMPMLGNEGQEAVQRPVPTGQFTKHTLTGLNPLSGALVGLGAGALTGLAAGVATGILLKSASGERP